MHAAYTNACAWKPRASMVCMCSAYLRNAKALLGLLREVHGAWRGCVPAFSVTGLNTVEALLPMSAVKGLNTAWDPYLLPATVASPRDRNDTAVDIIPLYLFKKA